MDIKKLHRIKGDKAILGGVCAGISCFLNSPSWAVRLAAILIFFGSMGFAIFIYLLLWVILPTETPSK